MWWRRRRTDDDFREEIDAHLALDVDRRVAEGSTLQDAHVAARRAFGNLTRVHEQLYESRRMRWLDDLRQDVKYGTRTLVKSPTFTIVAVVTLALGIGANTAIFSVVDAVLLKPLPFLRHHELVIFMNTSPEGSYFGGSEAKFNIWRRESSFFNDVSAFQLAFTNTATEGGRLEQRPLGQASADFFRLFGVDFALGRGFSESEDQPHGGNVAVLGHHFWQQRLNGDPQVLGKTVRLDDRPHVVVGVLGPRFDAAALAGPRVGEPDVWVPFQIDRASTNLVAGLAVVGRLRPGISMAAARRRMIEVADDFRRQYRQYVRDADGFSVQALQDFYIGDERTPLITLASAVALVLLIACANVASLVLARATSRSREMAMRRALGASRGRILRQLLVETALLSGVGGALGSVVGQLGVHMLLATNGATLARIGDHGTAVTVDWPVLMFAVLVSLSACLACGLWPALTSTRDDLVLVPALSQGGKQASHGLRQRRAHSAFVLAEIALAVGLLVGSALLIRTFVALQEVRPGFDGHDVLSVRMSLGEHRYATTTSVTRLVHDGEERLRSIPGVISATAACCVPLEGNLTLRYIIDGRPLDGPYHGMGGWRIVGPHYFETFKIPVLRGRAFTERDTLTAPGVVIINEAMARQWWPQRNPIGDRLSLGRGVSAVWDEPSRTIIGVVADVRDVALNREALPTTYVPLDQLADGVTATNSLFFGMIWLVRTRGTPDIMRRPIEQALNQVSGGMPVTSVRPMDEVMGQSTAREAFRMWLMTVFGVSALLIAAIGIFGVMGYSVQQRTREIGIRVALGADKRRVRWMVLAEGLGLAAVGMGIGLGAAFGVSRFLASQLFGITPRDPLVFSTVPVILGVVALVAAWVPANRAASVDPIAALKYE